ncbi:MAG: transglycosylase domain-containing protein [Kineosporiaceae bacterium]
MARPSGRRGVSRDYPADVRTRGSAPYGAGTRTAPPRGSAPRTNHGRPAGRAGSGRARGGGRKRLVDYPRSGRRGLTRWIPSWRLVGSLVLAAATVVVLGFFAAYATTPIPDGKQSATFQTSTVYFRDGTVLGRFQQENRTSVAIDQVPVHLRQAVIAAEDRSFETNSGVSVTGMVRAVLNNAQGGSLQGGSTITQQYVKNYYLNPDRTYTRKLREVFIALKLGRTKSKDEILEGYLNTIYFGRNANGVQAAARAYFGKTLDPAVVKKDPSKALTPSESAYLAGIINGPELYDPADGTDSKARAQQRWQFVVDGMVAEGYVTADQASTMKFPKFVKFVSQNTPKGYRGYLLQMVRKEATANGITASQLDTAGYDIQTTFDRTLMDAATKSVDETLPARKRWPDGLQVAMSSIDVATGEIRAIYGGDDYLERQRNAATQDTMQAGSTFKPFTLLAALQGPRTLADGQCKPTVTDGAISLDSRFDGRSPQDFKGFERPVRNFGNSQYGMIDLRRATANSVNTVYVALNEEIGPKQTRAAAICAGIPAGTGDFAPVPSNVLGSASPHPIDMAFAYATIANNGKRTTLHGIKKIQVHQTKKTVYAAKPAAKQVFDKDVTANAIDAMQQVVQRGSGTYAQRLGRPVAGKTGTSSDNYSAWFVGFTPQIATSVAMYRVGEDGSQVQLEGFGQFGEITGGSYPVRIWTDYMSRALDGVPVKDFPGPVDLGEEINPAPPPEPDPTTSAPEPSQTATATQTPTVTGPPTPTDSPTGRPTVTFPPTDSPSPTRTRTRGPRPTATQAPTP